MKFQVKVKPRSSKRGLVKVSEGQYQAFLHSAPEKGEANEELIELISEQFQVPKRRVGIIAGAKSKTKIIEII